MNGAGWNLNQSLIAVGSGGPTGKGFLQGTQNLLGYLPRTVTPNDFLFSVIAEEQGFVGSLGVALSGGQKQRVLLARALYRKPQVLFLDEAFDQLDLAREREITERLKALGISMVIVSHRPETVRAVDRTVRLGAA